MVRDVAGSALMSLMDACKGFNQIVNTERARKMLAILARSGQFLPRCLTFGPHNGPEDFGFAVDRVFSPGRGRKMRHCKQWQIYADDTTVRTGRVVDGTIYTDEEYAERTKGACKKAQMNIMSLEESFRNMGYDPEGLSKETKERAVRKGPRKKAAKEDSGAPSGPLEVLRPQTAGEAGAVGLNTGAPSFQSPFAHVPEDVDQDHEVNQYVEVRTTQGWRRVPERFEFPHNDSFHCPGPRPLGHAQRGSGS